MVTVHTCKECRQTFLSWKEFDVHVNRHLQRHLDEYAPKIPEKKTPWEAFSNIPKNMNRDLLKVSSKVGLSTGHGNENRTIEQMNHRNGV
jgi:hypothetical protein